MGKSVILRGEKIAVPKNDRTPHLSELQAYNLLSQSLKEYIDAIKHTPKRLVLHKTSNFSNAEIDGFRQASVHYHIQQVDLITIMDSDVRLYREGAYPPMTHARVSIRSFLHKSITVYAWHGSLLRDLYGHVYSKAIGNPVVPIR